MEEGNKVRDPRKRTLRQENYLRCNSVVLQEINRDQGQDQGGAGKACEHAEKRTE